MLITDNAKLLSCARRYYDKFGVPTCDIASKKKKRRYRSDDKADLDIFCDSDAIGIIVNLSQEINSRVWNEINTTGNWDKALEMYYDSALLSVLSGIAIDQTKREYDIECMEELAIIKEKYELRDETGKMIKPKFFEQVAKKKGYYDPAKKNYSVMKTPMDYICSYVSSSHNKGRGKGKKYLSLSDILNDKYCDEVADENLAKLVIDIVKDMNEFQKHLWASNDDTLDSYEKKLLCDEELRRTSGAIEGLNMNHATMKHLIKLLDESENNAVSRKAWKILYGFDLEKPNSVFMELMRSTRTTTYKLERLSAEDSVNADMIIFGTPYMKVPA